MSINKKILSIIILILGLFIVFITTYISYNDIYNNLDNTSFVEINSIPKLSFKYIIFIVGGVSLICSSFLYLLKSKISIIYFIIATAFISFITIYIINNIIIF